MSNQMKEDELFTGRQSVALTPQNAMFSTSAGGLISLDLLHEDGSKESFERIVPVRAFPISAPDEFISIREPDTRFKGRGQEIGMIRKLSDFDEKAEQMILAELERRDFTPSIQKIYSMHEKFGYSYWKVATSAGEVEFVMNNPTNNIRTLENGRVLMYDIDGNCFTIEDPQKLDRASFKKVEIYL